MFTDQLDYHLTAPGLTILEDVEKWLEEIGLAGKFDVEVVTEHGPGGGAAIVAFHTKSADARRVMLSDYFGGNEDEVDDYIHSPHFVYSTGARLSQGEPAAHEEG